MRTWLTTNARRLRLAGGTAVVTILAIVLTLATTVPLVPELGPAVLGAMLCITLSRSQLERDARGRIEAGIALPVIGLAAAGIGFLLLHLPVVGALVYVLGMTLSVWLRRFGAVPRRIGSLLVLPFVALLVAPAPIPQHPTGPLAAVAWLVPPVVALIAFAWVTLLQLGARAIRLLPPRKRAWERPDPAPRPAADAARRSPRLTATDRLAAQMALSLGLAFVIGFVFFGDRWAWIVLTVVVVTVGNAGRADVLWKGLQRVGGAAVGTLLALVPVARLGAPSAGAVALLVAIVFLAVLLREFGYVWWALFFTLALSIVQGFEGGPGGGDGGFLLGERLEEILLGSVVALLIAWVVLPVRSEGTIRRRLGAVLAALQERMATQDDETAHALRGALADLAKVSRPYEAWHRVFRRARRPRAAQWIATTRACVDLGRDGADPEARKLLGEARRALRDPDALQPALDALRARLRVE
ncbi:FUSC family protein [Pseudolysinimonas sp.]|uniref:FUSC family protein n=1 Tax=Pseudolysinimonas sp. TaxID=2680009 RepID=UPI003F7E2708